MDSWFFSYCFLQKSGNFCQCQKTKHAMSTTLSVQCDFLVNHTHHEPLKWAGWVGSCYFWLLLTLYFDGALIRFPLTLVIIHKWCPTILDDFWQPISDRPSLKSDIINERSDSRKIRMWPNLMRLNFFLFLGFFFVGLFFVFRLTRGKGL